MAIKSALLLALASTASAFIISPAPMTHNEATLFCASQQSKLFDLTSVNRDEVHGGLVDKAVWIGSWDFNYYSGECIHFNNGHVGAVDCNQKFLAICNDRPILKSTRDTQDAQDAQVEENIEADKLGARPSRRHQKPCHKPCDKPCHKPCDKPCELVEECVPNCGFEYVYLTQTVSQVYTSIDLTTVFTSTITIPNFTATVAAYVVTEEP